MKRAGQKSSRNGSNFRLPASFFIENFCRKLAGGSEIFLPLKNPELILTISSLLVTTLGQLDWQVIYQQFHIWVFINFLGTCHQDSVICYYAISQDTLKYLPLLAHFVLFVLVSSLRKINKGGSLHKSDISEGREKNLNYIFRTGDRYKQFMFLCSLCSLLGHPFHSFIIW